VDSNAQAAGINTLFGGTGNTTFIQTAGFTNGLTMIGGAGNDSFQVANPTQLGNDKIVGNGGSDTLTIASNLLAPQFVADGAFSNVSGIQTFIVNSSTNAVLGTNAQNAGISTVIGSSASDTINASAFTNAIRIDETANTTVGDSLVGGSAADTFVVSGQTSLALSSINGNGGTDTLIVNTPATLSLGDLAGVTNVEALQLTGASSVLITDAITGTSISTVYGGQGNNVIDASNVTALGSSMVLIGNNLGADTLKGGGLSDTLQGFDSASTNANSDTLYGGASADTFVLGASGSNGYGQTAAGSPVASIADFNKGSDFITLFNHGAKAADYSVNNVFGNNWTITDNITKGLVANVGVASGAPLDLSTNVKWV
jgi:Ca2+-binding RTX toxin-like protein